MLAEDAFHLRTEDLLLIDTADDCILGAGQFRHHHLGALEAFAGQETMLRQSHNRGVEPLENCKPFLVARQLEAQGVDVGNPGMNPDHTLAVRTPGVILRHSPELFPEVVHSTLQAREAVFTDADARDGGGVVPEEFGADAHWAYTILREGAVVEMAPGENGRLDESRNGARSVDCEARLSGVACQLDAIAVLVLEDAVFLEDDDVVVVDDSNRPELLRPGRNERVDVFLDLLHIQNAGAVPVLGALIVVLHEKRPQGLDGARLADDLAVKVDLKRELNKLSGGVAACQQDADIGATTHGSDAFPIDLGKLEAEDGSAGSQNRTRTASAKHKMCQVFACGRAGVSGVHDILLRYFWYQILLP